MEILKENDVAVLRQGIRNSNGRKVFKVQLKWAPARNHEHWQKMRRTLDPYSKYPDLYRYFNNRRDAEHTFLMLTMAA